MKRTKATTINRNHPHKQKENTTMAIGDVVTLNSDTTLKLTVIAVEGAEVKCTYLFEGRFCEVQFPEDALAPA